MIPVNGSLARTRTFGGTPATPHRTRDIGNEIKNARKQRKLTREKLAELSGLSRARIEALENGRVSDMGFKRVLTLMNIVGLDFRLTTFNNKRPTLEDIIEEDDSARLDR